MSKNRKKSQFWSLLDILVLLIQLVCSAFFVYLVKDLLPQKYWVIVICLLAVFWAAMSTIFAALAKKIRKRNKGKKRTVCLWLLSLIFSAGLIYGSSVIDQGLDVLDDVTDVTYQTHVMSVIVKADSTYEKISQLADKNVGTIALDEKITQIALDDIAKKEKVSMEHTAYESIVEAYNALMTGEVEAMLVNDAYTMIVAELIPEYTANVRVIYQFEIVEEIEEGTDDEFVGDIEEPWDNEEVTPTEEPTPTPTPDGTEPTDTPTPTEKPTPTPTKAPTPTPIKRPSSVNVTKDAFNILISGIDTYGSVSTVSRSDVNMIVTVNPKTKKILMTSIPRDYYVVLASKGAYDKLTHSGIYGVRETERTLENLFGIQIDYYVKVNFSSLEKIVNSLGGITVNNPRAFLDFPAGNIYLDGASALRFSRERHSFAGGDNERVKNQQRVLTGIINKAISPAIITNYSSILNAVSGSFVTNMSSGEIQRLIQMQLNDMSSWSISTQSVTGYNSTSSKCYSMRGISTYVMKINYSSVNSAAKKINSLF